MGLRADQAAALDALAKIAAARPHSFASVSIPVANRPAKAPARVAAGKRAKARGERTEDALDAVHAVYRARGLADMVRLPTPMRILGAVTRGRCTATLTTRSTVDYMGTIGPGGRSVALELKRRAGKRLAVADVADHQWAALERAEALGALALVLVVLDDGAWVARAQTMRNDATARDAKSWGVDDLDRCGARLCGLDWLAAVVAMEGR